MNCKLCEKKLNKELKIHFYENFTICSTCYDLRQAQGLDQ